MNNCNLPCRYRIWRLGRRTLTVAFAVFVVRWSFSGCEPATVAPEPAAEEVAGAVSGAMADVVARGLCDGAGMFWLDGGAWRQAMTGRSTGTAGVIKGVLAGIDELEALSEVTETDRTVEIDRYLEVVRSAADWLVYHAAEDPESGGVFWPACVSVPAPFDIEASFCPEDVPVVAGEVFSCAVGLEQPFSGLEFGVAGIGDVFLDLSEEPLFTPEEQERYLAFAIGAGDWLLSRAVETDFGSCWPEMASDDGAEAACYTSLARGIAGVGWFLVRLSHRVPDGTPYLNGALAAAGTLEALMVPAGDSIYDSAYLPLSDRDPMPYTGFYQGNAGIAYFLMTLYQETGRALHATLARSILAWLQGGDVMVEELDGLAWVAAPTLLGLGPYTGWDMGVAGTGWTFLQAARVFGGGEDDLEQTYLETANRAATWLSHPEIAHYYQGLVWWPERDRPWVETPVPPSPALKVFDTTWAPAVQPWWLEASPRAYLYYTGLLRGGAGIGWFLLELSDTLSGLDGWTCYRDLHGEVASQAVRWLYYKGEPSTGDGMTWSWYASIVRTTGTLEYPGEVVPGYEFGVAGALSFLGAGAASETGADSASLSSPLGFRPLHYRAP